MNIIESVTHRENDNEIRLTCGHEIVTPNPHVRAGNAYYCPVCRGLDERRDRVQPCTDAQLDAVAADYAETMRCRGFAIGIPEEVAIRRAATIQDAWRVAFARVLK
jgi:hypothetical protein